MSGITYVRCTFCNKVMHFHDRLHAEKLGNGECATCTWLAAQGVRTIEQYNAWLRKNQSKED